MILLAAALALAQEESTESFRFWTPLVGHRSRLKAELSESMWMKVSKDDAARPVKAERGRSFEAVQVLMEVEERRPVKVRRTFVKAAQRKNLWETPHPFQGSTVIVARSADGPRVFAYENGRAVPALEEEVMRTAFFDQREDKPEPAAERSPLVPKEALRLGQSVALPAKAIAFLIGGDVFVDSVNIDQARATTTFKAVETRAGARTATLVCSGFFPLRQYDGLVLEAPIIARLTFTMVLCVDGSRPDYANSWVLETKGTSPVTLKNGVKVELEIDNRNEVRLSQQTLTDE